MRKVIGAILLLLVFAALFGISCFTAGVKIALFLWGVAILTIVTLATAVWLIFE